MLTVTLAAIAMPVILFAVFCAILAGHRYEMDWGNNPGSFFAVFALFRRVFYVIFGVGVALGMVFAWERMLLPAIFVSAAAMYGLLFNIVTALSYEAYLHGKYPNQPCSDSLKLGVSPHTAARYAQTLALGVSSVILFVIGFAVAVQMIIER